ncbi:hypothetical protein ACPB8Q_07225 [Methanocaldococcus indicus]|uniref:hypothetical protein n=1 Tax=Methanocaldococcus indicus TaxID=213231 RepID=UPI003C6D1969
MRNIAHSWINNPNVVGLLLMIEGIFFWIVPILLSNFYLNYGMPLLKNIFNVSVVLVAIGMLIGFYLSKILLSKNIKKYVIFEKKNLEKFFKIFLFSFPLVILLSAILIKYLIIYPLTSQQLECLFIILILSYAGGFVFAFGVNILKNWNQSHGIK